MASMRVVVLVEKMAKPSLDLGVRMSLIKHQTVTATTAGETFFQPPNSPPPVR